MFNNENNMRYALAKLSSRKLCLNKLMNIANILLFEYHFMNSKRRQRNKNFKTEKKKKNLY